MTLHKSSPNCMLPAAVFLFLPGKNLEHSNDTGLGHSVSALVIITVSHSAKIDLENGRVFV